MKDNVRNALLEYYNKYYDEPITDDDELIECLLEETVIKSEEIDRRRWWNVYIMTCKVGDNYFQYENARTTGDMSAREAGYDFDPSTIKLVKKVTKTITVETFEEIE